MKIQKCRAISRGGAISVGDFRHLGGDLRIRECSAKEGGGIAATTLTQEGGTIVIQECHAQRGGAVYINIFDLRSGNFTVQGCTAQKPADSDLEESVDQWWAFNNNYALARGGAIFCSSSTSYSYGEPASTSQSGGKLVEEPSSRKEFSINPQDSFAFKTAKLSMGVGSMPIMKYTNQTLPVPSLKPDCIWHGAFSRFD